MGKQKWGSAFCALYLVVGSFMTSFMAVSLGAPGAQAANNEPCREARKFVFFASTYSYDASLDALECRILKIEEEVLRLRQQASSVSANPALEAQQQAWQQKRQQVQRQSELRHDQFAQAFALRQAELQACQLIAPARRVLELWMQRLHKLQALCN